MADSRVKVQGTKLEVEFNSAATAREVGASVQNDAYRMEGGVAGWVRVAGHWIKEVTHAIGRGTFEGIAWVLMAVGVVIAFISWSRLLPLHNLGATEAHPEGSDLTWPIGLVGAVIVIAIKVSAARQAVRLNERDDAQRAAAAAEAEGNAAVQTRNEALAARKTSQADFWFTIVWLGLAADALAAFAFAAAVTQDAETGKQDYDVRIDQLEREAKNIGFEAEAMPRPRDEIELLVEDLLRELRAPAYNNAGVQTPLSRAEVIGWGIDASGRPLDEPREETYCLPGSKFASYVDRYCEDVIAAHRLVKQKQAWLSKVEEANAIRAEAEHLRSIRPAAASGMAVGNLMGRFGIIWRYIPSVFLMAVVLLVMVYSSFVAKRDLEGD